MKSNARYGTYWKNLKFLTTPAEEAKSILRSSSTTEGLLKDKAHVNMWLFLQSGLLHEKPYRVVSYGMLERCSVEDGGKMLE